MNKLKQCSGETLVESLASILVVTLTFLFLMATITTSAHINDRAKESDVSFQYDGALQSDGFVNIWMNREEPPESRDGWSLDVDKYLTDNGYIYYNRHVDVP